MKKEDLQKYVGLKVLIECRNGLRFTTTIPEFKDDSFEIIDKYDKRATINCEHVMMVYEQ